jgi:hypothetical protein
MFPSPPYDLLTVNDQIKEDEMGRASSTNWEKRNACRKFMGKARRDR